MYTMCLHAVPSDEISDYLSVYGLRTYGQIDDKLVSMHNNTVT